MKRVGIGYDIHRTAKGRRLMLGGVEIPHTAGLAGHSDADVLLHAVIDALLGAAALPDIGHYFPPSDPEIEGISSSVMLAKAVSEVQKAGWEIANVDTVLVAEAPKISPHRAAIRARVARLLHIPVDCVQVKGKTNEGLDAIGEGKAMAAHAVVLLMSKVQGPMSNVTE
ncbi:MAG TPA: 2-C-methyl-D-erythritol 2,4-cyclodiphosphate synthase [Elusimicrobiota bacterium]|nr:2-C-methyl-D-erythritol 2,4-cyclodiphosphate synthase [Elusimicrobiota bacterium]